MLLSSNTFKDMFVNSCHAARVMRALCFSFNCPTVIHLSGMKKLWGRKFATFSSEYDKKKAHKL